jgi:phage terminase small subunit
VAGLTNKQKEFIKAYAQCLNATEAARIAGYSPKTAHSIGWENLRKPEISEQIRELLNDKAMKAEEVSSRLADQARGIPADCFTVYGPTIAIDFDKLAEYGLLHLIKKLSYDADGRPRVEFYDAQSALVQLGRAHKLFTDGVQVEGEIHTTVNIRWANELDNNAS